MPLSNHSLGTLLKSYPPVQETGEYYRLECFNCHNPDLKFYVWKHDNSFKCFQCGVLTPPGGKDDENSPQANEAALQAKKTIPLTLGYVNARVQDLHSQNYRHIGLSYLINQRHLTREVIDYFKLGYDPERNVIVIPNIHMGQVKYINHRYLDPDHSPKYLTYGTKQLYNFDYYVMKTKSCVIFEGEFDCMSSVQLIPKLPAFATGGKGVSNRIKWELFKKYEKVYLYFDDDGYKEMEAIATRLGKHRCYLVKSPKGYKDLNSFLNLPNALEVYQKILQEAECYGVPLIAMMGDYQKAAVEYYTDKEFKGVSTGFPQLDAITAV